MTLLTLPWSTTIEDQHQFQSSQAYHTFQDIYFRKMQEEVFCTMVKIVPDTEFLTNTADLKTMLEAIPEEAFNYEEDTFEKDFKVVLNSQKGHEEESDKMTSFNCDQCSFRATSKRCLNTHFVFVHDPKFFNCDMCHVRTRTEQAMHYHIDIKHNIYWDIEEEARNTLYTQRERQGHPQQKEDNTIMNNSDNATTTEVKVKTEVEVPIEPDMQSCEFCDKSFLTDRGLVVHISKMHKENWRNKDKISHNIEFNLERTDSVTRSPPAKKARDISIENIEVQLKPVNKGVRYSCDQCEFKTTKQNNLTLHQQSKHEGIRYSCDQCEYKATTPSSLTLHQESKHEGVSYTCDQCEYKAITQRKLTIHQQSKHEGVSYSCDQCEYKAKEKDEEIKELRALIKKLQDTIQEANDVKIQFLTKIPTKKLSEPTEAISNIINSIEVEQMTHNFRCEKCGKGFRFKGNLLGHKECIQETNKPPYKWQFKVDDPQCPQDEIKEVHRCMKCEHVFEKKALLGEHMDNHMDTDTTKSSKSDESSTLSPPLIAFSCENCRAEFPVRSDLFKHMNEHITDTANEINIPEQLEEQPTVNHSDDVGDINEHELNTQEGTRRICTICGRTRNTKTQMDKHMKTHDHDKEDDSTFTCGICDFQSQTRDQLVNHLIRKHDIYTCNSCNVTRSTKNGMNTHIIENHKSHKPCINYPSCEYDGECRYKHIKLKENEHICFKCGVIVTSVKDLMKHIKETHGSEPCNKFAQNNCARGSRCWFSHSRLQHNSQKGAIVEDQGFHITPTRRLYSSVVGAQTSHQNTQVLTEQILKMIPQIVTQVVTALSPQMNQ